MDINKEELINSLPTKWKDITLQQYITLVELLPSQIEHGESESVFMIKVVSAFIFAFTGHNVQDLKLNASEVMKTINKFNAFQDDTDKTIEVNEKEIKSIDEIDYDSFIKFLKYQEMKTFSVYPQMISLMLTSPVSPSDIIQWDMQKVNSFFLRLLEILNQYLEASQHYLMQKMKL